MDHMDIFDKYLAREMTEQEQRDFEARIKTEPELAQDFKAYLLSVRAVCQEQEQDHADFVAAMRHLTQEGLREIIGLPPAPGAAAGSAAGTGAGKPSKGARLTRPAVMWCLSTAAILIVAFTVTYGFKRDGDHRRYELIADYNFVTVYTRSGEPATADLRETHADSLRLMLPALERAFHEAPADDALAVCDAGVNLAMAYLKTHDRKRAVQTLRTLMARYPDDAELAAHCHRLIRQIEE